MWSEIELQDFLVHDDFCGRDGCSFTRRENCSEALLTRGDRAHISFSRRVTTVFFMQCRHSCSGRFLVANFVI
jgi:hypothetical protein